MIKVAISAGILFACSTAAFADPYYAEAAPPGQRDTPRHVLANGRCDGISYGTGARRCGTDSGGPVGGISGRN